MNYNVPNSHNVALCHSELRAAISEPRPFRAGGISEILRFAQDDIGEIASLRSQRQALVVNLFFEIRV